MLVFSLPHYLQHSLLPLHTINYFHVMLQLILSFTIYYSVVRYYLVLLLLILFYYTLLSVQYLLLSYKILKALQNTTCWPFNGKAKIQITFSSSDINKNPRVIKVFHIYLERALVNIDTYSYGKHLSISTLTQRDNDIKQLHPSLMHPLTTQGLDRRVAWTSLGPDRTGPKKFWSRQRSQKI